MLGYLDEHDPVRVALVVDVLEVVEGLERVFVIFVV